jgi:hypothetical protein
MCPAVVPVVVMEAMVVASSSAPDQVSILWSHSRTNAIGEPIMVHLG